MCFVAFAATVAKASGSLREAYSVDAAILSSIPMDGLTGDRGVFGEKEKRVWRFFYRSFPAVVVSCTGKGGAPLKLIYFG